MIMIISFLTLLAAFLVVNSMTSTTTQVSIQRDQRTLQVLQEAKSALIIWAASEAMQTSFQPGALPCPDRKLPSDANTGFQEATCTSAASRIGRFPWRTLGASDLRDGNGDQLWYVISSNFRKAGTTVINGDTQGQITITGAAPASNVIAVIFSPGPALRLQGQGGVNQDRDPTNLTKWRDQSNFLEGSNSGTNDNTFESRVPPNDRDAAGNILFNDKLITITHSDLFAVVEPAVASMLSQQLQSGGSSVKDYINLYRTTWGRYPFPAAFNDPCTATASDCKGVVGLTEGWLPLTTDSTSFIDWKTSGPAPTVAAAPGNLGTVDVSPGYANCGNSSSTQLECKFDWCGTSPNLAIARITATANKAGLAFVRSFIDADLTVARSGSTLNTGWTSSSATVKTSSSYAVQSNADGTVSLDLEMPSRACTSIRTARIRIPEPPFHSITSAGDAWTGWFITNEWHKQVYYAVATDWLPGGSGNCALVPPCLTVNNWPSSPNNNKGAILILAGRSLNGSARPSANLSDYLEGENVTPGDFVFEHRVGAPSTINDRVVVLYP